MTNETPAVQKRTRFQRVFRVLALGGLLGVVVVVAAHFAWKYSGSNEWKQEIDRNGIKVYSKKAPGSTLKHIKVVTRLKARLPVAMAAMTDEDCSDFMTGCGGAKNVVPYDPRARTSTDFFVVTYPEPFSPREYLFKTQFSEDARTKAILMEVSAVPDLLPRNECCYRIPFMDNSWRLTPFENGELEVEFIMHMDQGLPYVMINRKAPDIIYEMAADLPRLFAKEKYQTATADSWVQALLPH